MLEDPNCGARQASTQHQRHVIQLITQNKATLKQEKRREKQILFKLMLLSFFFIFLTGDLFSLCEDSSNP